jgi:hypothetical protein
MSSQRSYDPITRRRGTRGFAAVVTSLAGFVTVAAILAPAGSSAVDPTLRSWLVILGVAAAVAYGFAVVGLIKARPWSARLVGYQSAIGVGVSAYTILVMLTGIDPFGTTSALPAAQASAAGFGLAIWMIGLDLVAARFAAKGFPKAAAGGSPRRSGRLASAASAAA